MISTFFNYFIILISFFGINKNVIHNYEAHLTIPKISLNRYIYNKKDIRNDLEKNIVFVEDSDTPLTEKGNVIIAGHSGASTVSYFKDLRKLTTGDVMNLEYKGYIYKYEVDLKYLIDKTGKAAIRRNDNLNTLTLVTCYGNDKQLIVISNLIDKIKK